MWAKPRALVVAGLFLGVLPAASAAGGPNEAFCVAERGREAASAIVIPASPTPSQRYAAEEFRTFTERLTGVKLAIAEGAPPQGAKRLVRLVPWTAEGEDAFRLTAKAGELEIAGGTRGILYGVYEVLEKFGGCRWYSSWCEKIPHLEAFTVPAGFRDQQKPAFHYRLTSWHDIRDGGMDHSYDFTARCRVNGSPRLGPKHGGPIYRFGAGLGTCHTFNRLLPLKDYAQTHPEYYALRNGKRCLTYSTAQPCLSNPDVLRIVTSNMLALIRSDPSAGYYGVSQNDNFNYCQCPNCQKIDAEEGSHAGTVIRFVNKVAEAVEREYPKAIVETLAYQYSRKPPKFARPRDNVMICLCSIECDFSRPIPASDHPQNVSFCSDIVGWGGMAKHLYVWDYTVNFPNYLHQFPNFAALQGNLKFFRDNRVTEMFEQGCGDGRRAYFAAWKGYLLTRLMWNPDLDVAALEKDFFEGFYGKEASAYILAYYHETIRRELAQAAKGHHHRGIFERAMKAPFDHEFYDWAEGLWAKAIAASASAPKIQRENVWLSSLFIDYARALWGVPLDLTGATSLAASVEKRRKAALKVLEAMKVDSSIHLAEWPQHNRIRIDSIKEAAKPIDLKGTAPGEVEEWAMRVGNPNHAVVVEDPRAGNGRAIKFFNTHYEWSSSLGIESLRFKPNTTYRVRVRVRVEKDAAATEGCAFWTGLYDYAARKGVLHLEPALKNVKSAEYEWYDLGTAVPRKGESVWFGPPRFPKGGKSPIKAVYLDKVAFIEVPASAPAME